MCGQGRRVVERPMNYSGSWEQWGREARSGQPDSSPGWPSAPGAWEKLSLWGETPLAVPAPPTHAGDWPCTDAYRSHGRPA